MDSCHGIGNNSRGKVCPFVLYFSVKIACTQQLDHELELNNHFNIRNVVKQI